ncbi:CPBP family intramembrane glutamic endopeptidase [Pandoraea sp. PE-S2R-1]|uniref:CPBP family intramembrane glutamic endopeptidase n=1 Tax=Pandoraea sp. PE-S2R-1 TaxID=1986994 RepID=UPI000B3FA779|nr:CPBP family intramembrane glutamic endopeptidase [Pandoraea sp. PE-S2R-1]
MIQRSWSGYITSTACVRWVTRLPSVPLMFVALLLTYTAAIPVILVTLAMPELSLAGPGLGNRGAGAMILLGCLIAPLLETAVFQWACIRLLNRFKCPTGITIAISATLFALAHTYSAVYVLMTFVVGLVLAATFVIEDQRGGRPFLVTMAVHMMRNAITTVYFLYFATPG